MITCSRIKMRFKSKKYARITTLCLCIIFLFNLLCRSQNKKVLKSEFQKDNATSSQYFSLSRIPFRGLNDLKFENRTMNVRTVNHNISNGIRTCKQTSFPLGLQSKSSWRATDRNRTAYVFSAYIVDTNTTVIIGIKAAGFTNYYCQLWYHSSDKQNVKMEERMAQIITISEGHGLRYTTVLFKCILAPATELPTHVSIVSGSCETPMNLLEIQILRKPCVNKHRFTVCLTPLNFRYNRDYELIEWIELNLILGAEKFIVYNYSTAVNVKHVLDYYSLRGLTEVVQWNLPVRVDSQSTEYTPAEIHYFGQVAALQDCLYRNKGVSEFIVNLDLDEFIIPHGEDMTKWSEMLTHLKHDSTVYLFRNTFFKKEWNSTGIEIQNKPLVDKLRLVTLQKLQHERKLYLPKQRSKYFAKTADVSRLMIHEVPGVSNMAVPIHIGLLHHYRNWGGQNDSPQAKILDKTVPDKFSHILIKNVQKVWLDLEKIQKENKMYKIV